MKKVKFIEKFPSKEQIQWGGHEDPGGLLMVGVDYDIDKIEVRSHHTRVFLKGFAGYFNSVWFEDINDAIACALRSWRPE